MTLLQQSTIDRYEAGMSLSAIGKEDGVSKLAIYNRLQLAGHPRRRRGTRPTMRCTVYDIVSIFCEKGSWIETASSIGGCTPDAVRCRARYHGFRAKDARHVRLLSPAQREAYRIALDEQDKTHDEAIAIARGK